MYLQERVTPFGWAEGARAQAQCFSLCCYTLLPQEFVERREKYHRRPNFPSKRGEKAYRSSWICVKGANDILEVWQETKELHSHTEPSCPRHTNWTTYSPSWGAPAGALPYCLVTLPLRVRGFDHSPRRRSPLAWLRGALGRTTDRQTEGAITASKGLPSESS